MSKNSTPIYKENYFGFVYLWYDHKKKRFYLGCHMGATDDGYICSSNLMRMNHKRRPQDFKRRILYYHPTEDHNTLYEEEKRWLNMISDEELGRKYYNIIRNIFRGIDHDQHREYMKKLWEDPERKEGQSKRMKKAWTPERKKAHSEKLKKKWADGNYSNRQPVYSDEYRRIHSEVMTKHNQEIWGNRDSEETQAKLNSMSKSATIRANTPEHKERFQKIMGAV